MRIVTSRHLASIAHRIALSHHAGRTPGGAELKQPVVGTAEGVNQVLVQRAEELQSGLGARGEERFARLTPQLEDDLVIEHRTCRAARLAADQADLAENAAGGKLGKELLTAARAHGHVNAAADNDEAAAAGPAFAHY
jgi:hypothetical protein